MAMRTAIPTRSLWLLAFVHRPNCTSAQDVLRCAAHHRPTLAPTRRSSPAIGSKYTQPSLGQSTGSKRILWSHNSPLPRRSTPSTWSTGAGRDRVLKTQHDFSAPMGLVPHEPVSGPLRGSDDDGCRQNRAKRPFSATVLIFSAPTATNPRCGWLMTQNGDKIAPSG